MSAMFLAMVWHARRRQAAMRETEAVADNRAVLLLRQEHFLHDVTHELRTPVTIARGHLELLHLDEEESQEVAVALDELGRIERIISRLLLLAKSERPDFLAATEIDMEAFLEDVFVRWSEVAPRVWRLGPLAHGTRWADAEALRTALDALLENAVKYTEPDGRGRAARARVRARGRDRGRRRRLAVCRRRRWSGSSSASPAPTTRGHATAGGVGLGLAIVDAIARAHGGRCVVTPRSSGAVFGLHLPHFEPVRTSASPEWSPVAG